MDFSPLFENDESVYVEKTKHYKNLGEKIKSVEFVALRSSSKLFFVEGKCSSPKPDSDHQQLLDDYLDPIVEKFWHSFQRYLSIKFRINVDSEGEFPSSLFAQELPNMKIVFLLVIKGHKKEWLMPILDSLHKKLIVQKKIWKIDVAVWNDETALHNKFILPIS